MLTCYDEAYASEREGFWAEELQSERDGVRVYEWKQGDAKPFAKRDEGEQVSRYLRTLGRVEESKFKLDSVEQIVSPRAYVIRSFLWIRGTRDAAGQLKASAEVGQPKPPDSAPREEAFETQALFRMWLVKGEGDSWKITKQEMIRGTTVTGDRTGFTDMWGRRPSGLAERRGRAVERGRSISCRA